MTEPHAETVSLASLPPVAQRFLEAMNRFDVDAMAATFTDDALLNDFSREFVGAASIRPFLVRELAEDKVTARPVRARVHHGDAIVDAEIDGIYDKTGLPSPLVLTFYFTVRGEKLTQLAIILNKPAIVRP